MIVLAENVPLVGADGGFGSVHGDIASGLKLGLRGLGDIACIAITEGVLGSASAVEGLVGVGVLACLEGSLGGALIFFFGEGVAVLRDALKELFRDLGHSVVIAMGISVGLLG